MNVAHPGFSDPVGEAQACFRAVLDAMARPGRIVPAGAGLTPPPPLDPAMASVLLTLADADTKLWLDAPLRAASDWVRFHCGASEAAAPDEADFALARSMPDLGGLAAGTHEEPEAGATLILQIPALGTGRALVLSGPGLEHPTMLRAEGLPDGFAAAWAANRALFPRGVDLILCAGTTLAALPRSVAVTEG